MIKQYKEKAPTLQAIVLTEPLEQAPEVANMIGAKALIVDMTEKAVTFKLEDKDIVAGIGQVVYVINGSAEVADAKDFFEQYEAI